MRPAVTYIYTCLACALAGGVSACAAAEEVQGPPGGAVATVPATPATTEERRGYWWNKEPPEPAPAIEPQYPDLPPPPSEHDLLALHPQEVEKLIESYREYALWKMEPKHVLWYYELQDFARRRSRAFMNVTELVMLQHPDLNMQTVYPTNPPGQAARVAMRQESIAQRIRAEREGAALIMLSRRGCEYCTAMRAILKYFQERYGWTVQELDIEQAPAQAARFATEYTPTTVIIFRGTQQWMPVAVGVETLERVEEGVYRAVRYVRGETTPEQYTLQEFHDGGLYDPQRVRP
jgi:conjugal transfer pilus assembly protein TraF